jgi:hypothetical protein
MNREELVIAIKQILTENLELDVDSITDDIIIETYLALVRQPITNEDINNLLRKDD